MTNEELVEERMAAMACIIQEMYNVWDDLGTEEAINIWIQSTGLTVGQALQLSELQTNELCNELTRAVIAASPDASAAE